VSVLSRPGDPLKDPEVISYLQRTGVADGLPAPGMLDHALDATVMGLPRGAAELGATIDATGNLFNRTAVGALEMVLPRDAQGAIEWAKVQNEEERQDIVTDLGRVEHEWRPDPITTGAAGQIGNELSALLPRTVGATLVGGPLAGAVAAGAPAGAGESARLQAEGVDLNTANTAGAITGVTTGVGAVLPGGGMISNVAGDVALAAAGNVGLGIAQRGATHEVLDAGGYTDQAAQFRALDGAALATDLVFSLLLSGAHHLTSAQVDAALVNKNADNFARGDGLLPANGAAAEAAAKAKTSAISDLLAGRAVNVAGHVADAELVRNPFHADPTLPDEVHAAARAADPVADTFDLAAERIIGLESGGKANAKNPASSATGAGQFIESTWLKLINRTRPDLVAGKTRAQVLALRTDGDLSHEMTIALAKENGAALEAAGVEVTPDALYAAHHFGPDKAIAFARAAGDTPMEKILTPSQVKANRYLAGKTKDEVLANWEKRSGAGGGARGGGSITAAEVPPELASARSVIEALDKEPEGVRFESGLRIAREGDDFRIEDFRNMGRAAEGAPAPKLQSAVFKREDAELAIASAVRSEPKPKAEPQAVPLPDHPQVQAVQQLAAEAPNQPILTGYDADNQPVFRSLAEAVTEIHTEHAAAVNEADAFTVGAECFLRQGAAA
jgi:hypothetical protein